MGVDFIMKILHIINILLKKLFPCPFNECKGSCQCGKGGGKVEYPGPTETETQMQKEQLGLLQSSNQQYSQLQPYMLKTMGLKKAADGSYIPMTQAEITASYTPEQQKLADINKSLAESIKSAYAGGNVSAGLESDLASQLAGLGGGGTIGQQQLANYQDTANIARDEARRRMMNSGIQNFLGTSGALESSLGNQLAQYRALPNQSLGLVKEYANLLQPYGQERQGIYSSRQANAARKLANQQGNQQMIGTGLATAAGIAAALI